MSANQGWVEGGGAIRGTTKGFLVDTAILYLDFSVAYKSLYT